MSAIRFPKLHVATSVVNRILNAAEDIGKRPARGRASPAKPDLESFGQGDTGDLAADLAPDPTLEGAKLDLALEEPVPEVAPNPDVVTGAAVGDSPLESLLDPPA